MLVIETILSNCIEFTDKVFMHIIVKEAKRGNSIIFIRFDIIDTGIGIKEYQQSNIYDVFSLGDSGNRKKYKAEQKIKSHASDILILLVEDNLVNQKITYFALKKMGFLVDIVENGEEDYYKYQEKSYQVILMDIQIPIMDGFETTEKIRLYKKNHQIQNQAIILAVSANVIYSDIQRCFELGMNEFISKPFSSEKLLEKIGSYFCIEKK